MKTILVINALNGVFPLVLQKKYPTAKITCAEIFPFYKHHLRNLGFEVVDWDDVMDMKFDIVVGNPPYQSDKRTGTQPLWPLFVHKCAQMLTPTGHMAMITPNKWCGHTTNVIKGDVHLYSQVFKNKLVSCNIQKCSDQFPSVGGYENCFSWFVIANSGSDQFTATTLNDQHVVKAEWFDRLPLRSLNEITHNILQKVKSPLSYEFKQVSSGFQNQNQGAVVISQAQRIHYRKLNTYWDKQSNINPTSKSVVSQIVFPKSSQKKVHAVFGSELFQFIYDIFWNGDNFGTKFYNSLPYLDLNKLWSNDSIYQQFGLTSEEIKYIQKYLTDPN